MWFSSVLVDVDGIRKTEKRSVVEVSVLLGCDAASLGFRRFGTTDWYLFKGQRLLCLAQRENLASDFHYELGKCLLLKTGAATC